MTFLTFITFNQLQSKPLVCTASPLPPSWAVLQRNLLTFRATPGSEVAPPAPISGHGQREHNTAIIYWPVCKFDLILATLSQCINQCSCLSLTFLQWIAIASRMSVFSVSFIVFSMFFMPSVKSLCSIVLLPFSAILTNLILFIFHVPSTIVCC